MGHFCWHSDCTDPPGQWDLRRAGWQVARGDMADVVLADTAGLMPAARQRLLEGEASKSRLILLSVDDPHERAELLARGCGEALPAEAGLAELAIRAGRLAKRPQMLPRLREAGPVTLDLLHRDGRMGERWLALHPREFALIWRLAENPGRAVTRPELLREVWRLRHEPETNSVQVHVSRLRAKLAVHGLGALVATDPAGGYKLAAG